MICAGDSAEGRPFCHMYALDMIRYSFPLNVDTQQNYLLSKKGMAEGHIVIMSVAFVLLFIPCSGLSFIHAISVCMNERHFWSQKGSYYTSSRPCPSHFPPGPLPNRNGFWGGLGSCCVKQGIGRFLSWNFLLCTLGLYLNPLFIFYHHLPPWPFQGCEILTQGLCLPLSEI